GRAGGGGAGERQLVDAPALDELCADVVGRTGDDVDDALGDQARLVDRANERESGERRVGRRLEHYRVAHGDRWGDLPHGEDQRIVPGNDPGADADRLTLDEVPRDVGLVEPRERFVPGNRQRLLGKAAEVLDGQRAVEHGGLAYHRSRVLRLEQPPVVRNGLQVPDDLEHDLAALQLCLEAPLDSG